MSPERLLTTADAVAWSLLGLLVGSSAALVLLLAMLVGLDLVR